LIKNNKHNRYALIRVSTKKQNEKRQVIRMIKLGIPQSNIVIEKESGKSTERKKYHSLINRLEVGDVLYIENIDRLSRDYDGIISEWHRLTKQKGIIIRVLDTPMIDSDQADNSLFWRFIRNILLHILAFQSEVEWHKIKERQAQGIAAAKESGKNLGRAKTERTEEQINIINQYLSGETPFKMALSLLNLKKSAFYKLIENVEREQNEN